MEVAAIEEDTTDSFAVSPNGQLLAYTYSQFGRIPSNGWHVAIIALAEIGGNGSSLCPAFRACIGRQMGEF